MAGRSPSESSVSTAASISSTETIPEWDNLFISDRRITGVIESVVFGDREFTWIDLLQLANNKNREVEVEELLTRTDELVNNLKAQQLSLKRIVKRIMERKKKGENVAQEERLLFSLERNRQQLGNNQLNLLKVIENMVDEKSNFVEKIEEIRIKLMDLACDDELSQELEGKKFDKKQHQRNV